MEPEDFRLALNSLIQALRNVTWLLQKQKASLPDFSAWYGQWQESARQDPIMTWIVRSRNRIVKEADLELLSRASVFVSLDWLNEIEMTWTMPPRYTNREILIRLLSTQDIPPVGVLTVERKWIDRLLPEHELLDACAHAYRLTASIISMAHDRMGIARCNLVSRKTPCVTSELLVRPMCMLEVDETRKLHINLETRAEIAEYVRALPGNRQMAIERYGENKLTGDAIAMVPQVLEMNKTMLSMDGALMTVAILMRGNQMIDVYSLEFYDQSSKRIAFHKIGEWVRRSGADGVVVTSETWVAFLNDGGSPLGPEIVPARDRPGKKEAITVIGLTSDGRASEARCLFARNAAGQFIFDKTVLTDNKFSAWNSLESVRKVWQKERVENESAKSAGD